MRDHRHIDSDAEFRRLPWSNLAAGAGGFLPNPAGEPLEEPGRHRFDAHRAKVRRPTKADVARRRRKATKIARRTNRGQR